MKLEELKERIIKKEEQIKKIEKRIEKHEFNKTSEKFLINEYGWFQDFESRKEEFKQRVIEKCNSEIKRAKYDLEDAKVTLKKYMNLLEVEEEKSNKPVVKIFKDFFESWKQEIKEYVEPRFNQYLKLNSEYCDLYNNRYNYLKTMTEEEYITKRNQVHEKEKALLNDPWIRQMYDCRMYRTKSFDEVLDKYMEDRYFELVDKVTKFTGEISDVSRLYIGLDGSLNGTILGESGIAKIETIIAGGYNIQCRHYRVLVHGLK